MMRALVMMFALIWFLSGIASYAAEYSVLVIPSGLVGVSKKNILGNTDIEELFARSIIKHLENAGMACAPTMSTLKISIRNNPNFVTQAVNPLNNAKILSKSYGISRIILVSSNIEVLNASKQKSVWNKLELPVITPMESNIRVVTTVTLLNTQTDDIIWSNVFYKNINCIGNGINNYNTNESKLGAITGYYDELAQKVISEMKEERDTRAIMINTKPVYQESQKTIPVKVKPVTNIKPNLEVKENIPQPVQKENKIKKIKNAVQLKYNNVIQDYENKKIKRLETEINNILSPEGVKEDKIKLTKPEPAKTETETTKESKPAVIKENKTPLGEKVKTKYNDLKENHAANKEIRKNNAEKAVNYSNVMRSEDSDTPPINNYIQTKPRKNSRKYTPQFDSSINDI